MNRLKLYKGFVPKIIAVFMICLLLNSYVYAATGGSITVVYKSDGGEVLGQYTVTGEIGEVHTVEVKDFQGYRNLGRDSLEIVFKESAQTIEIVYEKLNRYILKYDGNGAKGSGPEDVIAKSDEQIVIEGPGSFNMAGYEFAQWNTRTSGNGKTYAEGDKIKLVEDLTLYAQWKKTSKQQVIYYGNGNTSGAVPTDHNKYAIDDKVKVLDVNNMGKDGAVFAGWNTRRDGKGKMYKVGEEFYMGSENLELYAVWTDSEVVKTSSVEAHHNSIMSGYPEKTFMPDAHMTRGEVAKVFANLSDGSYTVSAEDANKFTDVDANAWYYNSVMWMNAKGVIKGYEDSTFKPKESITRAEFTSMVANYSGLTGGKSNFSDVPAELWSKDAIDAVYAKGWIKGYSGNTFKPDANITRAEVVVVLNRMLDRVADKNFIDEHMNTKFTDVSKSHWAYYDIFEGTQDHYYSGDKVETWTKLGK